YRTARGRVSNAGDLPRFIGLLPCSKADNGLLPFSSIAELRVAEYLAWSPKVLHIAFEPREISFEALAGLPAVTWWPDFEVILEGGECEWVEAKYAHESLSERQRQKLDLIAAHCERERRRFRVVYRQELEKNGFAGTISL